MLQRKSDPPTLDDYISVIADPGAAQATGPDTVPLAEGRAHGLEQVIGDALDQLRQITQEHAALGGQVLTLERQVRTLLIERLELSAQVAALQRENAQLRADGGGAIPAVARPAAFSRYESLTPLRGGFGRANGSAGPDDETLLMGNAIAEGSVALIDRSSPSPAPVSYILIAQPFGRFSDLGRFQTAVQALRGVQNARVRRFAQGTLEMRLDYDGAAPLREALSGLALAVEAVEQIDPQHLMIRLRPDSLV